MATYIHQSALQIQCDKQTIQQDISLSYPLSVSQCDYKIPASAPYIYKTIIYRELCDDQNNNNDILCTNILENFVNVNNAEVVKGWMKMLATEEG